MASEKGSTELDASFGYSCGHKSQRVLQVKTSKVLCMLANAFFDCNTLFSINRSTAIILENKSASQAREVPAFLPSSPYHYIPPSPHSLLPRHLWVLHLWFQYRSRWCHRTRESTGYSRFLCISQLPSGLHPSTVQKQKSGSVSEGKKQLHSHHYLAQQLKEKHHQDYFFYRIHHHLELGHSKHEMCQILITWLRSQCWLFTWPVWKWYFDLG